MKLRLTRVLVMLICIGILLPAASSAQSQSDAEAWLLGALQRNNQMWRDMTARQQGSGWQFNTNYSIATLYPGDQIQSSQCNFSVNSESPWFFCPYDNYNYESGPPAEGTLYVYSGYIDNVYNTETIRAEADVSAAISLHVMLLRLGTQLNLASFPSNESLLQMVGCLTGAYLDLQGVDYNMALGSLARMNTIDLAALKYLQTQFQTVTLGGNNLQQPESCIKRLWPGT